MEEVGMQRYVHRGNPSELHGEENRLTYEGTQKSAGLEPAIGLLLSSG